MSEESFTPSELEQYPLVVFRGDVVDQIIAEHLGTTLNYAGHVELRWTFDKELNPIAVRVYEAGYAPER
jgi:hypothetical protein